MREDKITVTIDDIAPKGNCGAYPLSVLEAVVNEAEFLYRSKRFPLKFSDEKIELTGSGIYLTGKTAEVHLDGSTECFVLVGTLGERVDRLINKLSLKSMSEAYTADLTANTLIEKYLDALCLDLEKNLENGEKTSNRFSAGYGDLPLNLQPKILSVLESEKVGVTVSEELLMHPLKTVTAFVGVGVDAKKVPYTCADCSRYYDCDKRLCYDKL